MSHKDWYNRLVVDMDALRQNLLQVRERCPNSKIMAVLKANAYGHHIDRVAPEIYDYVDGYAVAHFKEGIICQQAIEKLNVHHKPVQVLSQLTHSQQLTEFAEHGLDATLHSEHQIDWFKNYAGVKLNVWLKVDTGMTRLGINPENLDKVLPMLNGNHSLNVQGLMTHLASADDLTHAQTSSQLELSKCLESVGLPVSISNSAGVCGWPNSIKDWVRPGIMLYGASPLVNVPANQLGLQPAMTLQGRIFSIKSVAAGTRVGYGGQYQCHKDSVLGLVSVGYGDGYPRVVNEQAYATIEGQKAGLAGRVSMDMICLDLTDLQDVQIGDTVTLWGSDPSIDQVAEWAATIPHELLCQMTSRVEVHTINSLNSEI